MNMRPSRRINCHGHCTLLGSAMECSELPILSAVKKSTGQKCKPNRRHMLIPGESFSRSVHFHTSSRCSGKCMVSWQQIIQTLGKASSPKSTFRYVQVRLTSATVMTRNLKHLLHQTLWTFHAFRTTCFNGAVMAIHELLTSKSWHSIPHGLTLPMPGSGIEGENTVSLL